MTKTFKQRQYEYQCTVVKNHPEWFGNDQLNGVFRKNPYSFILAAEKECNNLFEAIRGKESVIRYFTENGIGWWGGQIPSNHLCSSQIACVNHLFLLRDNPDAVLALANGIAGKALGDSHYFDGVRTVGGDKAPQYISFEVVTSKDYLNESKNDDGSLTRGSQCTSVDAAIIATKGKEIWLLPIEWKFVEEYNREDKSKNVTDKKTGITTPCGDERKRRYFDSKLVWNSDNLKYSEPDGSIFFQEPYYQLMRQTLWAEQAINNKDRFFEGANKYLHVHVVPEANDTLRNRKYRAVWDNGKGMVENWKSQLKHPDRYICIDPKDMFSVLCENQELKEQYSQLIEYLRVRYWEAK